MTKTNFQKQKNCDINALNNSICHKEILKAQERTSLT